MTLSHDVTWQIEEVTSPLPQDLLPITLGGRWLTVMVFHSLSQSILNSGGRVRSHGRGLEWIRPSHQIILPLDYTIMLQMKKNEVKIQIFILREFRTTKRGWVETCTEKWFDQIMLNMPQSFSPFGCFILLKYQI